jgi:predicted nucleic acid-binding Zn ribbon protein
MAGNRDTPDDAQRGRPAELAALDRLRTSGRGKGHTRRRRADAQWTGRDPMLVGEALDHLVAERGWETNIRDAEVVARFAAIVGPDIAAHASPRSFDDATLVIQATDNAWATELRLLTPQLLARFADVLGPDTVAAIQVTGPTPPRRGRRRFKITM